MINSEHYNQQLKSLFRSNTINNIKLGISLALSQGYSWNYIAEKCLEEWLLFDRYKDKYYGCKDHNDRMISYKFTPNDYNENYPGVCWFEIIMNKYGYEHYRQLKINDEWVFLDEDMIKSDSLEELKQPAINRMEEFLKLIYENEYNNM